MTTRRLPAPPVAPTADLRGFPFMALDVARLRDSELVAVATGDEFRAAVLLWCAAWHQVPAGSLPLDERSLSVLAGCGRDLKAWGEIRAQAMRGWYEASDGRLYHPVVAEKVANALRERADYAVEREKDRERLRRWRDTQRAKRGGNAPETPSETRFETGVETRTERVREGEGDRERGGEPPAAAAAGAAPPPKAGAAAPSTTPDGGALGLGGPAPRAAAAASSKLNPDANGKLRALLGKYGLAASPQATLEWEGMLSRKGLTKASAVKSFLAYCAKHGDVQFAREGEPLVRSWLGTHA